MIDMRGNEQWLICYVQLNFLIMYKSCLYWCVLWGGLKESSVQYAGKRMKMTRVNPYTLKKDSHPISSYNITPESHITATRIEEIIIN